MAASVRWCLTTAVAASAVVLPPTLPSTPSRATEPVRVELAASVEPFVQPLTLRAVVTAGELIGRVDPTAVGALAPPAGPSTLNAASDFITSGYQATQYWVDYGVELADYVLGFIPFGYVISDQVNILYYNLIRPIADSVVYQLINPKVNDPLNPSVYVNGFVDVGQASINAAINTGIAEFNLFFGRFVPPLPPLPPLPFQVQETTVQKTVAPEEAQPAAPSTELDAPLQAKANTPPPSAKRTLPNVAAKTLDAVKSTTSALGGVRAQGEVRAGSQGATAGGSAGAPGTVARNGKDTTQAASTPIQAAESSTAPAKAAAEPDRTPAATTAED